MEANAASAASIHRTATITKPSLLAERLQTMAGAFVIGCGPYRYRAVARHGAAVCRRLVAAVEQPQSIRPATCWRRSAPEGGHAPKSRSTMQGSAVSRHH